jgi:hypothetical protein
MGKLSKVMRADVAKIGSFQLRTWHVLAVGAVIALVAVAMIARRA